MIHEIRVSDDKGTVWINDDEGSCIGRFSRKFGIDVHNSVTALMNGEPHCLFCTHEPAGEAEWKLFIEAMSRNHAIEVDSSVLQF